MNTDDVQYLDWQWVEEHPESALDLMLKLHSENAALRSLIDDPNAMHSHYLRECNGWEVWQAERIRQFQDANEQLEQLETENAALRSLLREAIREHIDPYDLPEGDHYIARVEAALGEAKP